MAQRLAHLLGVQGVVSSNLTSPTLKNVRKGISGDPMSDKEKPVHKALKFEDALAQLEKIIRKMESGELTLDQAIASFEEGSELRKFCEMKLNETELRVEAIIKNKSKSHPEKMTVEKFNQDETKPSRTKGEDSLL